MKAFTIHCAWDDEAGVWSVADSDVPGLAGEAPTIENVDRMLRQRIPELISLNMPELDVRAAREVPWSLVVT